MSKEDEKTQKWIYNTSPGIQKRREEPQGFYQQAGVLQISKTHSN